MITFIDAPDEDTDTPQDSAIDSYMVYRLLPPLAWMLVNAAHDVLAPGQGHVKVDPVEMHAIAEQLRASLAEYLVSTESMMDLRPNRAKKRYPGGHILPRLVPVPTDADLADMWHTEIERLRYSDIATLDDDDLTWVFQQARGLYRATFRAYQDGRIARRDVRLAEKLITKVAREFELRGLRLPL